jgi:YVTN family beta-propeller protein
MTRTRNCGILPVGLGTLLLVFALLIPVGIVPVTSDRNVSNGVPKRSSSAIAITGDGAMLLVVNPDSNSLSMIDLGPPIAVTELPVGLDPRTVAVDDAGRRAYVANRGSDSVSVVDLEASIVISEVVVSDRPYGVVVAPAGDRIYVAEQGADQVRILDTTSLTTLAILPSDDRPSGLAISDDGRTLYVSHLLANPIGVFTVHPFSYYLPLVLRGEAEEGDIVASVARATPLVSRMQAASVLSPDGLPSHTIYLWPSSNLVQSIILSPDGERAYIPHTLSNTANRALTFDTTVIPLVSLIDLTTQQHLVGQQFDLGTLDQPGVGLPFDAAVTPDGEELWVLNAASNDISVIDLDSRQLVTHIEVEDNPRGIVLTPDGSTAYVNNTLAGTISVVDTGAYTVTSVINATDIPLPPALLNGKRLFHSSDDPRVSLNQWISCSSCHFEGEQDRQTWFFGFAGPRNTTSLLGMIETYPLRWSGEWNESADSEFANRKENYGSGLIVGDMNCSAFPPDCVNQPPNQGRSYDLDCLAAFMDSLRMPPSPAHAHGEPLTESEQRGQEIFEDSALACVTCHPPPLYTDQQQHDVGTGTPDEKIGPAYDTPTLRGLYDSAPYFHDGSAATLNDALTRPSAGSEHDVRGSLTEAEIEDLIAFLMALPFE